MSITERLKKMPTSYWVVGLGAAALGVDYLVEGESSIASSIWRGVTGGRSEKIERQPGPPQAVAPGGASFGSPAVDMVMQPVVIPSSAPGVEYMVLPFYGHHRRRRYYPAHEPRHVRDRGLWAYAPHRPFQHPG
ncbi:MAG TPA: hypothetical protein VMN82_05625, partial [Thermoanaerobaculia bacterium]|nr:hypothetical protein [Thermoanaerobaculia bacterium]